VPITRSGSLYFFFETKYRFPDISGQWPTSFLVPSFHSGGIRCGPPRDGGWYPDLGGKWEGSERSSTFVAAKFVEVPFLSLINVFVPSGSCRAVVASENRSEPAQFIREWVSW
jgi:hypothetical protein